MCWIPSVLLVAAVGIGAQPERGVAGADSFRVESAVYVGGDTRPANRITTIFAGGAVYDCTSVPAETVVFEPWAGRFVLLSEKYHVQTELGTADVKAITDRLQQLASQESDPLAKFLAEPTFKEEYDQTAGELTLTSPLVTYDVMLADEPDPKVVGQYRDFYDWSARLNAILAPGGRPPFARMAVNAKIAERHATASRVYLILSNGKDAKREKMHSDHRIVRPLAPADLRRIAEIRESMTSFKRVGFKQYRKFDMQ